MKKLFILAMATLTMFSACKDEETFTTTSTTDYPTNAMSDASFVPGDNFYDYCNNTWVMSHPLPSGKKSMMYWDDTEYNAERFMKEIIDSHDPLIARLMSDVEKLTPTPSAELVQSINSQLAEIDAMSDIETLVTKATTLGRKGYPIGLKYYLMPYKQGIAMQLNVEMPEPIATEAWTTMTGCTTTEAEALHNQCQTIADDWSEHISLSYHTYPYQDNECYGRAIMAREMGIAQQDFVYDTFDYNSFLDYTVTASQADNWKVMLKQAVVAYNYTFTTATKETLAEKMYGIASPFTYRLGRLYVDLYGHAVMRDFTYQMIEEIRAGYTQMLNENSWLSENTRQAALTKARTIKAYCGYPDKWLEERMGSMPSGSNLLEDWTQLCEELAAIRLSNVTRTATDDDIWYAIAQGCLPWYETNAMYLPECNKVFIFLPMMMPPLCRQDVEEAFNYGMLGTVIGHEFGHGFDRDGSLYDENGEIRDWFEPHDKQKLFDRMNLLADINTLYVPFPEKYPNIHSNGQQTMGEDVADLNGVNVAYLAMCNHYKQKGLSKEEMRKVQQQFFLAYGNNWAGAYSEEFILNRIKTNVHSVAKLRVDGIVRHIDAWYDLYDVTPGNKLYLAPAERVVIWNK